MKKLLSSSKARSHAITSDRYFSAFVTDMVRENKSFLIRERSLKMFSK